MPIKMPPYDLWPTKEPTARGVNGDVEVTLTVDSDEPPHAAVEIQVMLDVAAARSLRAQLKGAIAMAEVQLKQGQP